MGYFLFFIVSFSLGAIGAIKLALIYTDDINQRADREATLQYQLGVNIGKNEVLEKVAYGLIQQNGNIITRMLERETYAPLPIQLPQPQPQPLPYSREGGDNADMSARTHARTHENATIHLKNRCTDKFKSGEFRWTNDYVKYEHEGVIYFANYDYSTLEVGQKIVFTDENGIALPNLFVGKCAESGCINLFVSDSYQTKNCSEKCKNKRGHANK